MTKDTIYLKSGDAFVIMWEDSVEIVQPDGNSIITRRLEKNKCSIELIKRTPDEVKEIAERYEKQKKKLPFSVERNPYANTTQIQIGSHNIRYTN